MSSASNISPITLRALIFLLLLPLASARPGVVRIHLCISLYIHLLPFLPPPPLSSHRRMHKKCRKVSNLARSPAAFYDVMRVSQSRRAYTYCYVWMSETSLQFFFFFTPTVFPVSLSLSHTLRSPHFHGQFAPARESGEPVIHGHAKVNFNPLSHSFFHFDCIFS